MTDKTDKVMVEREVVERAVKRLLSLANRQRADATHTLAARESWQRQCGEAEQLAKLLREALAAPAEPEPDVYVLHFDDADMPIEVFMGYGARDAAFRRYAQARASWECHLLAPVTEPVPEPAPEPARGCGRELPDEIVGDGAFRVWCDGEDRCDNWPACTGEGSDDG